jgi:exodeoxyribonuclease V beta subunit
MKRFDPLAIPLEGVHLIEASAGTGKTYSITTLFVRLLVERELAIDRILVVTYTNAATAELRARLRQRVAVAAAIAEGGAPSDPELRAVVARNPRARMRLRDALRDFDAAPIHTIHGFCQRVIEEHAFESAAPFDLELITDQTAMLDEVVRDFWARELFGASREFVRHLQDTEKLGPEQLLPLAALAVAHPDLRVLPARDALPPGDADLRARALTLRLDLIDYARTELARRKADAGVQFFDDLLQRVDAALAGRNRERFAMQVRARYPAALIDEFQDTDPVQYRIFERLYGGGAGTLFLIGDPKQAIYAFRGADVFAYLRAKRSVGERVHGLDVNRRSDPRLIDAINALFGRARDPFVLNGIQYDRVAPRPEATDALGGSLAGRAPFRILFVPRAGRTGKTIWIPKTRIEWLYDLVAAEIILLLGSAATLDRRPLAPGDIAVLCRSNAQAAAMQEALRLRGVPTVLQSEASVLDTPEAREVERVLRAMADPADGGLLRAALATPLLGADAAELAAIAADERRWDEQVRNFQRWHDLWRSEGFTAAFRRMIDDSDAEARLLALVDGERRLTNVLHLGELLQTAAAETRRGPNGIVDWLRRVRRDDHARAGIVGETAQIRLESDTRALKLLTIHKSKGLQYPVVFCPFLWFNTDVGRRRPPWVRFHAAGEDALTVDLAAGRGSESLRRHEREELAESLRLLYVAVSRAQHFCAVVWGAFNECETSPLGYLLAQPPSCAADTDLAEATRARIKAYGSDDDMRADLDHVVAAAGGVIEVVDLDPAEAPRYADAERPAAIGPPRVMQREVRQRWRLSSFSGLAAGAVLLSEPAEEGVDRDEGAEGVPADDAPPAARSVLPLFDFPRGKRPGLLIHEIFERLDFAAADEPAVRAQVAAALTAYRVEPRWADTLCHAVGAVLHTPLDDDDPPLTLAQVPLSRRLSELEFVFPVGLGDGGTPHEWLSPARLADVFAAHGGAAGADYAARLCELPFAPLAGYLKGYIDLVFEHRGRWYVVDYKSNNLGPRIEQYSPAGLVAEMIRHHYVLQAAIYTVAVHRYLIRRLAGYDYDRHFGGVLYLFVRGMAPEHPPGCGVYRDRPRRALIEALSAVLDGRGRDPMA